MSVGLIGVDGVVIISIVSYYYDKYVKLSSCPQTKLYYLHHNIIMFTYVLLWPKTYPVKPRWVHPVRSTMYLWVFCKLIWLLILSHMTIIRILFSFLTNKYHVGCTLKQYRGQTFFPRGGGEVGTFFYNFCCSKKSIHHSLFSNTFIQ